MALTDADNQINWKEAGLMTLVVAFGIILGLWVLHAVKKTANYYKHNKTDKVADEQAVPSETVSEADVPKTSNL